VRRVAAQRAFEVAAAEDQQPVECVHVGTSRAGTVA
jgi:hypothetical protein